MSYRLEYQWGAFHVPGASLGLAEDRFVIAVEGGDNNVSNARTGKRARSWDACMIGTRVQVLRQAVYLAGSCEGGSLQPHGHYCTPESYIRRIRRLLEGPGYLKRGCWWPRLRIRPAHAVVSGLRALGIEPTLEKSYGEERAVVEFSADRQGEFFLLIDRYGDELPAWCWAEVTGLLAS